MRRIGIATILTAIILLLVAGPAGAGLQWCPRDPIIALNGQEVQIWVSVPERDLEAVTGPINVKVQTPAGVTREVLFTDEGFNEYGETVEFYERGPLSGETMDVGLRIEVPYDRTMVQRGDLPILVSVILPDGSIIELQDSHGKTKMDFTIPAYS